MNIIGFSIEKKKKKSGLRGKKAVPYRTVQEKPLKTRFALLHSVHHSRNRSKQTRMYTRTAASKWLKRLSFRSTAFNRTSETPTSINVPIFSSRCT